jgi:hypothetical protein
MAAQSTGNGWGSGPPPRRTLWSDLPASPLLAPAFALMDGAFAGLAGRAGARPLREWSERVRAFELFQRAPTLVAGGMTLVRDAAPAVEHAMALDPWERLWVLEGLGYAAGRHGGAERLFRTIGRAELPAAALIPLHTGCGLALAAVAVEGAESGHGRRAVESFVRRCRGLAEPAAVGALLEALGLAARTLLPERLAELAAEAAALDAELGACFWHGVGRALLFVPSQWLAWTFGGPLAAATREAPAEEAAANLVAGLAWATTLVGLRSPASLERLLGDADRAPAGALEDGIAGAVLLWAHANGVDSTLDRFFDHAARDRDRWRALVVEPCEEALATRLDAVHAGSFGDLFRVAGSSQ